MSAYDFTVEQRQVPGQRQHCWVAIDDADGTEIPLPKGGNVAWVGRYPEIVVAYLAAKNVTAVLDYSPARGDNFEPAYEKDIHTFTFNTGGGIVVKDIPRAQFGLSLQL
ncbi:MAG TPA: hypothetical protein VIT38_12055 [Allosphingosinicella sp.]